jgi:3-phenylpropionate/trans-cinnamate dioxygenase ferredoxin reductase subunit
VNSETILVAGAGHAAGELSTALRSNGFRGDIALLGEESHLPYQRPALSKGFLTGAVTHEQLYVRSAAFLENVGIRLVPNVRVTSIDRPAKTVALSDGTSRTYSKLVLATGGRPRRLSLPDRRIGAAPNIHYLRTIDDVIQMRDGFKKGARLLIVGGGYVGLEVAAAARQSELHVTLLETLPHILARVAAPPVSEFFAALHRAAGVEILVNAELTGFSFDGRGHATEAKLKDGRRLGIDMVLVGIGLLPNSEIAQAAGLDVDNGIVVDEHGQTSDPDILAIGDCSSHWNIHARQQVRLESVPSTVEQARSAAARLTGKEFASTVPWGWSDQYKLKLQMVGLNRGYDQVVLRGSPETQSFLVFYLKEGTVVAIDVVNRGRDFVSCKKLVAARARVSAALLENEYQPLVGLVQDMENG